MRAPSPFDLLTRDLERDDRAHQGSDEITVWCSCCLEKTIPLRNGCCAFCDTPLTDEAKERDSLATVDELALRRTQARADRTAVARDTPARVRIPRRRIRRQRGKPGQRGYTDEQIIGRIQLWERLTGSPPAKADWSPSKLKRRAATVRGHIERHMKLLALYEMGDFPAEATVRARFGSMNAALVRAGFEPRAAGRQPTTGQGIGRPQIGRDALERYIAAVQTNLDGDQTELKASLYELAMSAFWWADRLGGKESS